MRAQMMFMQGMFTPGRWRQRALRLGRILPVAVMVAAIGAGGARAAAPPAPPPVPPQGFANPNEAVASLVAALGTNDMAKLRAIFGTAGERAIVSGDSVADRTGRKAFVDAYGEAHSMKMEGDARATLVIGKDGWPFPVPLVKQGDKWHFDSAVGAQEIVDRRIGRNELMTIRTLLAMVEAQKDYFDRVKRGTGTGAFAQRFLSTPDLQDGLYWQAAGGAASPLGPLVDQAEDEGYPGGKARNGQQQPYHGYLFRILTSQGPNAPGGARDYVSGGKMVGGFAIVAWPLRYGTSGVVTFLVNADGVVFQKDLGPNTAATVRAMTKFDPDITWARVDISD